MYSEAEVVRAQPALKKLGWSSMCDGATDSRGTATNTRYNTGGVAILARDSFALLEFDVLGAAPGRVAMNMIRFPTGSWCLGPSI